MRYELLEPGHNDYYLDIEKAIAKNRGLNSLDELKNVSIENTHHYSLLKNIDKATECLINHLKKGNKIHIICDDDNDGYTSASIMYNYLKEIYLEEKISWNVHGAEKKIHGIKLKEIEKYQYSLLIVPDGTSNDYEQYKKLKEQGKDIILLDHHEAEYEAEDAIVVNNQLCNYPNKNLSGAGIVYKFCQSLDDTLELKLADNFLDLVALGLVGDMMDTTNLETQYYIQQGLKNINNPFFKALINKQSFSMKKTNMIGLAFYIAPLINAVVRVGTYEEKCNMFKSFIDNVTMVSYTKRGTKISQNVFLYEDMARQCVNIKSRQDRIKKKYVAEFIDKVSETDKIILMKVDDDFNRSFSGLMANDLANRFNKPCLVLKEKEKEEEVDGEKKKFIELSGSGRNCEHHLIKNFKDFITESGLAKYAEGHQGAFGVSFDKDKINDFIDYTTKSISDDKTGILYNVDFIIPQEKFKVKIIKDIAELQDYYGQGFKEPYIVIKDYILDSKDIAINEKMTLLSWQERAIKFVSFSNVEKTFNELTQHKQVKLDLVGRVGINEWKNEITYQFIIDNYNILSYDEKENKLIKKKAPSWF